VIKGTLASAKAATVRTPPAVISGAAAASPTDAGKSAKPRNKRGKAKLGGAVAGTTPSTSPASSAAPTPPLATYKPDPAFSEKAVKSAKAAVDAVMAAAALPSDPAKWGSKRVPLRAPPPPPPGPPPGTYPPMAAGWMATGPPVPPGVMAGPAPPPMLPPWEGLRNGITYDQYLRVLNVMGAPFRGGPDVP
jgi:hypothetical protein